MPRAGGFCVKVEEGGRVAMVEICVDIGVVGDKGNLMVLSVCQYPLWLWTTDQVLVL